MTKVIRKHSDIAECRETSAQSIERKLAKLESAFSHGKLQITRDEYFFQVTQLKAEIKKWRDESIRHNFQVGIHDEFVEIK